MFWSDSMTVKELKTLLDNYPEEAIVTYRHNEYGRVDVDSVECKEEQLLSGSKIWIMTFEASFKEDENVIY